MKRLAFAVALSVVGGSAAFAADLPPPALPHAPATYVPVIAPPYNWTGFYIGGNLGGAFTNGSFSDTIGSTFATTTTTSFIGGGQVGANYEFWGGVVIGAEAMFDWLPNTKNTVTATNALAIPGAAPVPVTGSATINNRWLTTATGKLGYAWDRVLLYGKGGGAWVGASNSGVATTFGGGAGPTLALSGPSNIFGWTAGVGVEWAFWGNWSARAEYDYIGLNNQTYTVAALPGNVFSGDTVNSTSRNIQIVTAGVNYKFGWW
jgi:outer membrane immunogenic protein